MASPLRQASADPENSWRAGADAARSDRNKWQTVMRLFFGRATANPALSKVFIEGGAKVNAPHGRRDNRGPALMWARAEESAA